jgi:cytochrome b6
MASKPPLKTRVAHWFARQPVLGSIVRILSATVLYEALDDRLSFQDALKKALNKPVPPHSFKVTFCLGGMTMICFVNQVVTGILLAVYYEPSAEAAYASVQHIVNDVPMGWLVRELHAWGAHVMIICCLLHIVRVFLNKAYRPPRELTWIAGALLLFLTLSFAFTGYLLPWDQLSFWGTTVGTEGARGIPLLGHYAMVLMRGGESVTGATLSRFFAVHTMVLPWVVTGLMIVHFALIRRLGISDPL